MQKVLFLAAVFLHLALSCNPGTGTLKQSATFHFDVYPPVRWTFQQDTDFNSKTSGAQPQKTLADANSAVVKDISDAITSTIAEYGGSIGSIEVKYSPLAINLLVSDCTGSTDESEYASYGDTIFYHCNPTPKPATYSVTAGTVKITALQYLYQSQWDSLSVKVQKKLSAKNVVFDENVHQV